MFNREEFVDRIKTQGYAIIGDVLTPEFVGRARHEVGCREICGGRIGTTGCFGWGRVGSRRARWRDLRRSRGAQEQKEQECMSCLHRWG